MPLPPLAPPEYEPASAPRSYCDIFYDEVETEQLCSGTTVDERNIRGGTVLHELTHALKGTEDVGYGCQENQQLSDSEKISNADNFNVSISPIVSPVRRSPFIPVLLDPGLL